MVGRSWQAFVFLVAAGSCTTQNPRFCDETTPCADQERPFCDIDGSFPASGGRANSCIPTPEPDDETETSDGEDPPPSDEEYELRIEFFGSGTGTVESTPSGLECDEAGCVGSFAAGSRVQLTAIAEPGSVHWSWGHEDCAEPSACEFDLSSSTTLSSEFRRSAELIWLAQIGGEDIDLPSALAVDNAGRLHVGGLFFGTLQADDDVVLASPGRSDGFILTYDTLSGTLVSHDHLSTSADDGIVALAHQGDSLLISMVAGERLSLRDRTFEPGAHVASLGRDQVEWSTPLPQGVVLEGIAASEDLVVGRTSSASAIDFGDGPVEPEGTDTFLASYERDNGKFRWLFQLTGNGEESLQSIHVDNSGNVLGIGTYSGDIREPGGPLLGRAEGFHAFWLKLTSDGSRLFSKSLGDGDVVNTNGIFSTTATDSRNGIIIATEFEDSVGVSSGTATSKGSSDILLARYTSAGALDWFQSFGGNSSDTPLEVALDSSDNIVLFGQFRGSIDFGGGPLNAAQDRSDYFLAKFDSDGQHLWSVRFGDGRATTTGKVAIGIRDSVCVYSDFSSLADMLGRELTPRGASDLFLMCVTP